MSDAFLPPTAQPTSSVSENPVNIGYSAGPDFNRYYQYWHHRDMLAVGAVVEEVEERASPGVRSGVSGMVDAYLCEDADFVLVTLGSAARLAPRCGRRAASGGQAGRCAAHPLPAADARCRSCSGVGRRGGRGRAGAGHLLQRHRHRVRECAGIARPVRALCDRRDIGDDIGRERPCAAPSPTWKPWRRGGASGGVVFSAWKKRESDDRERAHRHYRRGVLLRAQGVPRLPAP